MKVAAWERMKSNSTTQVNCVVCQKFLGGKHLHAKTCSAKCRQQRYRDQRKIRAAVELWERTNNRYASAISSECVTAVPGTSPSRIMRPRKGGNP